MGLSHGCQRGPWTRGIGLWRCDAHEHGGGFFGWQVVWLAFFLAPLFGVLIVVAKTLATGDNHTPFGPYLSAATAFLMLAWQPTWDFCKEWMFSGVIAPLVLAVLLVVLGALLWMIHQLKKKLGLGRR